MKAAATDPDRKPPMPENAIEIRGLEKRYGKGDKAKRALIGIDLDVPRGSIFGLLGPNGAGKSTCINIMAGLVVKTAGTVRLWGFDIDAHPRNARACIGVVPQELIFDAFFTPKEMLEVQAGLYGVPKKDRRTEELLKAVRLWDKRDAYSRTLSGGMKRRLLVAKALVHAPPILVLDEPTAGVDIELRQQLWDYVRELHARGTTIVLTTHYLEEAQELCDTIAIINHGDVMCCEATGALLSRIDEKSLHVEVAESLERVPDALQGFHVDLHPPHGLNIRLNRKESQMDAVLAALSQARLTVRDLSTDETDLEDVFLQLTGSQSGAAA